MMKKIKNYGLDKKPQQCWKCYRPNHSENTVCWYCDAALKDECKFCGYYGRFKDCGFPDWNLRFECPNCQSIRIDKKSESFWNLWPEWVKGGFQMGWEKN